MPYKTKRRPSVSRKLKIVALACFAVAVTLLLVGMYASHQEKVEAGAEAARQFNVSSTAATPVATEEPITFAAVGDSITEGNSPAFTEGRLGDLSWAQYAAGDGLRFVGGWADGGAQTARMVGEATPVEADVLVMFAGTNDAGNAVPFEESAKNLTSIADTVGAGRVIVSAIPPQDFNPGVAPAFNDKLRVLAADRGWEFVDAPAGVREGDRFLPGMTADGTHPTAEAARIMGEAIRAAILNG